MFLYDLLDDISYKLLIDKYEEDYLNSINYDNFMNIYKFFRSKKIYYIEDLIIYYLDIFTLDLDTIKKAISILEEKYGNDYVYIVGDNLKILEDTILMILER